MFLDSTLFLVMIPLPNATLMMNIPMIVSKQSGVVSGLSHPIAEPRSGDAYGLCQRLSREL